MQHCHHHLQGRLVQLLVLVYGYSAAVVLHGDALIGVDGHFYIGAIARHSLVDGVVYGLVDKMMQAFLADVSYVHGRTLAHGLKSLQNLNITCRVVALGILYVCHYSVFDIIVCKSTKNL